MREKLTRALAYQQQGHLEEAMRLYIEILAVAPDTFDALHLLGVLFAQVGRLGEAEHLFTQALQVKPDNTAALLHLGNLFKDQKRHTEALAHYEQALALRPDYVFALTNRGIVLRELKRYTEALASYDRALALDAGNPDILYNRGNLLHEVGRFEEAIAAYDQALVRNPADPQLRQQRTLAERASRRWQNPRLNEVKPTIDTWDVFDTLLARYCIEPEAIFEHVARQTGQADFVALRQQAQAQLDLRGQPYDIFDIYAALAATLDDPTAAKRLLDAEITAELDNLIPIQRHLSRVSPSDLLVSDMYLPPHIVQSALALTTGASGKLPVVLGNWGKASGLIWPALSEMYNIRCHHGDNPHADQAVPARSGIACENVTDAQPSAWEKQVRDAGLPDLARVLRQVRLALITDEHSEPQRTVVGPLLTLFVLYSLALVDRHGSDSSYTFCSRDCDELLLVFGALFPTTRAAAIDFSRRLLNGQEHDDYFSKRLEAHSVIVDLISSGRSVHGFLTRTGAPSRSVDILLFLDDMLDLPGQETARQLRESSRLIVTLLSSSFDKTYSTLESMLEPGYPAVRDILPEPHSGALIKAYFPDDKLERERAFFSFKARAVATLLQALRQRQPDLSCAPDTLATLLRAAVTSILDQGEILEHFPTFRARETRNPY
jgi:tetratricopeptide (TPR) repeat protein